MFTILIDDNGRINRHAIPAGMYMNPNHHSLSQGKEKLMALPNILFVICDDLGINDLHCYGRDDHNTPHLDRLAEQGMRFTSAYACQAICSASRGFNADRIG